MSGQKQGSLILRSGLNEVYNTGVYPNFALKYFMPVYDSRTDLEIHDLPLTTATSAIQTSASVLNVDTASSLFNSDDIDGEYLFNLDNLAPTLKYRIDYDGNIVTNVTADPTGTTTANTTMNSKSASVNYIYNTATSTNIGRPAIGDPDSASLEHYAADNVVYNGSGGFSATQNFTQVPAANTIPASISSSLLFDSVDYISNEGNDDDYGVYQVRLPAAVGSFKFNKIVLFGQKVDTAGNDIPGEEPFAFAVVALNNTHIKLSSEDPNNSNNVTEFIADITIAFTRSVSGASEITYNPEEYWSRIKTTSDGTTALEYPGSVLISPINGGVNEASPKSKLHLIEDDATRNVLRFSRQESSNQHDGILSINPVTNAIQLFKDNELQGIEFSSGSTASAAWSMASGLNGIANGEHAIAFGEDVVAGGLVTNVHAHAYGVNTSAIGQFNYSHGSDIKNNGSSYSWAYGSDLEIPDTKSSTMVVGSNMTLAGATNPNVNLILGKENTDLNVSSSVVVSHGANFTDVNPALPNIKTFSSGFYNFIDPNARAHGTLAMDASLVTLEQPQESPTINLSASVHAGVGNKYNGQINFSLIAGYNNKYASVSTSVLATTGWDMELGNTDATIESSLLLGGSPGQLAPINAASKFGTSGSVIINSEILPITLFNFEYESCFVMGNGHLIGGGLQPVDKTVRSYMFTGGFANMVSCDYSFNYGQNNILNSPFHQQDDTDNYVHNYALGYHNNHEGSRDDSSYQHARNVHMFGAKQNLLDCENVVTLGGTYDPVGTMSNYISYVKHGIIAGRDIEVGRASDVVSFGNTNIIRTSACTDTVTLDSSNIYQMGQSNGVYLEAQSDGSLTSPTYTVPDSSVTSFHQFGLGNQMIVNYSNGAFADTRQNNVSGMTSVGVGNYCTFKREDLYTSVTATNSTVLGAYNAVSLEGVYNYNRNSMVGTSNILTANIATDWTDLFRVSLQEVSIVGSKNTIAYAANLGQLDTTHNSYRTLDRCSFLGSNGTVNIEELNRTFKSVENSDTSTRMGNASTVLTNGYVSDGSGGSDIGGIGIAMGAARINIDSSISTNVRQMITLPVNPVVDFSDTPVHNPINVNTDFAIPTADDIKAMIANPDIGKPPIGTLYYYSVVSNLASDQSNHGLLKVYCGEDVMFFPSGNASNAV